tara:strand:+ start:195 stop:371 length:177 start_codon:yes stop_codon:yes gene_type:complete
MNEWVKVAESDYTQCDIFSDELTGQTDQMIADAIADIIEEQTGERPSHRFAYKISVIW